MGIKTIEGLIAVKYLYRGDKAFQYFSIQGRKNIQRYLTDSRFIVYDRFEEKIKTFALSNDPNYTFMERRNEEDRVTLEFKIEDEAIIEKQNNFYFIVPGFVPDEPGCFYCKHKKDLDDVFFYCDFKQKTLSNKLKNCRFFRQREDLFKT